MRVTSVAPGEFARELAVHWESPNRIAEPRPFDRFRRDDGGTWWIVPSKEHPAFRHSKFIVSSGKSLSEEGSLFVGLYVEKGVGRVPGAAGRYSNTWILDESWSWHRVVDDLTSGAFTAPIAQAARLTGEAIHVIIEAHVSVRDPQSQPPQDLVFFVSTDGTALSPSRNPVLQTDEGFLRHVAEIRNLSDLGQRLRTVPSADWAWINFYVGLPFQKAIDGDTRAFGPKQVRECLLEPFARWFG